MAEAYYVTLAPHNSNGPISTIASLHLDMAINNCHMQELFLNSLDYYQEVLTNPLIIHDGYGAPPDGPGWGADLDDVVARQISAGPIHAHRVGTVSQILSLIRRYGNQTCCLNLEAHKATLVVAVVRTRPPTRGSTYSAPLLDPTRTQKAESFLSPYTRTSTIPLLQCPYPVP